jgi:hypothetical protein
MKHYDFRAWRDSAQWIQVPWGATGYKFRGDCILEGENFWISLHSSRHDAVFLYAKMDCVGTPSRHNELYRSFDAPIVMDGEYSWNNVPGRVRRYAMGSTANRILKNEPGEIVVESETDMGWLPLAPGVPRDRHCKGRRMKVLLTTRYRLLGGKQWFEVWPVRQVSEQGMHGESRLVIVPDGDGQRRDYVVDAMRYPGGAHGAHGIWLPDGSRMLFDLAMDIDRMWMMTWPDPFKARPYCINCYGGWPSGWQRIGEGKCPRIISSPFARFGDGKDKVVVGVPTRGCWNYQRVDARVRAGEVKRGEWRWPHRRIIRGSPWTPGGPWRPMHPGQWRIIGCVNGEHHTQEVVVTKNSGEGFRFKSPATGKLEYLVTYLYDRTPQTPPGVVTPMDIYREAILGRT